MQSFVAQLMQTVKSVDPMSNKYHSKVQPYRMILVFKNISLFFSSKMLVPILSLSGGGKYLFEYP